MASPVLTNEQIYGTHTITSPVLNELIASEPMQRLKRIGQYGVPDEYNALFIRNFTRFDHSIGTMLLLKKLHASEEEQIAGLLHDASHTAFSHVVDYVVGKYEKEDFQDSMHKNVITGSVMAEILKKYNYDPERIAHYENFGLLERAIPDICADRADYGLREFPLEIAQSCLNAMTNHNGKIVFTDKEAARQFAFHYLFDVQEGVISNAESAIRYMIFAKILKLAMKKKIIKFADFWTDDETIMQKIKNTDDKKIKQLLKILKETPLVRELPASERILPKKFRYVDPEFLENGNLVRVSTFDSNFVKEVDRARKENETGVHVPLLLSLANTTRSNQ